METDLTNKVLEALSLNMKETSMAKEISAIDLQIQTLNKQKDEIEANKRQYIMAQSGAIRAESSAKDYAQQADRKIKEALLLADKAIEASKEASKFATMARRPADFDTPIQSITRTLSQADMARKTLSKNINEVKIRKEELKKEGININLDGTNKVPTRIAI
jgi:hypothetical protein